MGAQGGSRQASSTCRAVASLFLVLLATIMRDDTVVPRPSAARTSCSRAARLSQQPPLAMHRLRVPSGAPPAPRPAPACSSSSLDFTGWVLDLTGSFAPVPATERVVLVVVQGTLFFPRHWISGGFCSTAEDDWTRSSAPGSHVSPATSDHPGDEERGRGGQGHARVQRHPTIGWPAHRRWPLWSATRDVHGQAP